MKNKPAYIFPSRVRIESLPMLPDYKPKKPKQPKATVHIQNLFINGEQVQELLKLITF